MDDDTHKACASCVVVTLNIAVVVVMALPSDQLGIRVNLCTRNVLENRNVIA